MVRKKVDGRVQGLIEQGVRRNHRSIFVLVGDHGKDQVENLHRILSKTRVKARPSVLWCYKKELGFSTHRKKRMREIKRNQSRGLHDPDRDDPFDLFISSTDIRWTYYKETEKILGQTFGMCVLQDFEALTPNLLARTIETVEGGGLVIILLKTVRSLKQLYTMTMDVHSRFRTEAHHEVIPRFNERFILSLAECSGCLVLDDELNILPICSSAEAIPYSSQDLDTQDALHNTDPNNNKADEHALSDLSGTYLDPELQQLKASLSDTPMVGCLVGLTRTLDQARAVLSFLDALSERRSPSSNSHGSPVSSGTVSLTAGRGRGKSAAVGLCLAGAVYLGCGLVAVTAPAAENLLTVFQFAISGLQALQYVQHVDFEVQYEQRGELGRIAVRIDVFKGSSQRQSIRYLPPLELSQQLAHAELLAVDEAAAIPLPLVKQLLQGKQLLSMLASTIHGYEGTGRSLSLKLVQQLRSQQGREMVEAAERAGSQVKGPKNRHGQDTVRDGGRHLHEDRWKTASSALANTRPGMRALTELVLTTPIRYGPDDPVERWLTLLLCMDAASPTQGGGHNYRLVGALPAPRDCALYMVNRDALFSFQPLSEGLLQRIWGLYTAAHYKSSPNDLQMLSDAPAHRLLVLLGPHKGAKDALPDVLCVLQVAFEGRISQKSVQSELARGSQASGDMIPWTMASQFNDTQFCSLSGARIVRIATHPDVQRMGYGSRAVELLVTYFNGELSSLLPAGQVGGEGADSLQRRQPADDGDDKEERARQLPPLLTPLTQRAAESLSWLGASCGLTAALLGFWTRRGFRTCYVRQTPSDLTGEHSAVLLRDLEQPQLGETVTRAGWLQSFVSDCQRRLIPLLSYNLRTLDAALAIALVDPERKLTSNPNNVNPNAAAAEEQEDEKEGEKDQSPSSPSDPAQSLCGPLTAGELLSVHMSMHDLHRLDMYARNMVDHHMVLDLVPLLASWLFQGRLPAIRLTYLQVAILLGVGLQRRDVDSICKELELPANQVLAFFNKTIRKIAGHLKEMVEQHVSAGTDKKPTRLLLATNQVEVPTVVSLPAAEAGQKGEEEQGHEGHSHKKKNKNKRKPDGHGGEKGAKKTAQ